MRKALPVTRKTKLYKYRKRKKKNPKQMELIPETNTTFFLVKKTTPTICILGDSRYIAFANQEKGFIKKGNRQ